MNRARRNDEKAEQDEPFAPEGEQVQAADLTACPARCSSIEDLDAKVIADYLKKSYGN